MPHIMLEYSDNVTAPVQEAGLLKQLHQVVSECGLFAPEAVKARSVCFTHYVLPEGAEHFAHITCSILTGRTEQQRAQLSTALFERAKTALPQGVKLSVNIHEMNKATYMK